MFNSQARQTATGENPVFKSPSAPSQVPATLYSAAAAASIGGDRELDTYAFINPSSFQSPSAAQLHSLLALPSGMLSQRGGSRGSSKRKGASRLVREGQIVSRLFDALGSRPQPSNGLSLEQGIQLEMTYTTTDVIVTGSTPGLPTYVGVTFAVSGFSGASALLSVFDQYRIDQLEVWLETKAPNSAGDYPLIISAVDLDDGNTPTSYGQVQDHQGAIMATGPAGHYHKFKPHIAIASFSGAFTSYSNAPGSWIDSASPNVQHFGLKLAAKSTATAFGYSLVVRGVMSFRAPAIN